MKDIIDKYKVFGRVTIWKYSENYRNYPGWNLTVDILAIEELSGLLDLMSRCEWSVIKTISTSIPTDSEMSVPNNRHGNAKWTTKPGIVFCTRPGYSPGHWEINEMPDSLEINFGIQKLQKLKQVISSISKGNGDVSISDENDGNMLTFWWEPY